MDYKTLTKTQLMQLYETNSFEQIGKLFGVGAEIIRRRFHKVGLVPRKRGGAVMFNPDPVLIAKEFQLKSLAQIAKEYGVGETTVWAFVKKHGIKFGDDGNGKTRKRPPRTEDHIRKLANSHKGQSGERAGNWKGGLAIQNWKLRQSTEYRDWKRAALELRGNKCQECGSSQGHVCECCGHKVNLHVHHVESFAKCVERRFDPTNSEVLCSKCHTLRHNGKSG